MRIVVVGKTRTVWRCVLVNILTLGIYRRVWLVRTRRELNGHEGQSVSLRWVTVGVIIPIIGPYIVAESVRASSTGMLRKSPYPLRAPWLWRILNLIPLVGTTTFMAWTQSRHNRFWGHERTNPNAGLEIDLDLESDPLFLVEMGEALKASYKAGGSVEGAWRKRQKAKWAARRTRYAETQRLRVLVRAAGGSTPILPWRRPAAVVPRVLHITCGRCQTRFDATTDGLSETVLLCPKCALVEVLPGAIGNVRAKPEAAAVVGLKVRCGGCKTQFHVVRNLSGETAIACPSCGRTERLAPAPHGV